MLKPKTIDDLTVFKTEFKTAMRELFSSTDYSGGRKIIVSAGLGVVVGFILLVSCVIILSMLLVFSAICLPVVPLVWFGLYTSTGISLWRLVEHSHGNTDGGANLGPSLYILYSLAVAQGVLSMFRSIWSCTTRTKAVKQVKEYYHLNDTDLVLDYVKESNARFKDFSSWEDGRWILVSFGMDLLRKSETPEKHISAVRAVFSTSRRKRQVALKQLLIGNESFNPMIGKLLQMMHPRSLYSRETRENAAGIVALLADEIHLEKFPGGVHSISSLLDTSDEYPWLPQKCQRDYALGLAEESDQRDWLLEIKKTYKIHKKYELSKQEEAEASSQEIGGIIAEYRNIFLQGLYIFGKLSVDHDNCRIISKTEGLMSRITAALFSILLHRDHHDEWTRIAEESLMLLCRLMAVPGDTGRKLRHQISSNDKDIVRMLHFVLGCDKCDDEILLPVIAVEIMLDLSVDTSSIMASRSCSRRLMTVLLQIFVKRYCLDDELKPFQKLYSCIHWMRKRSYIRSLAGQKLASISSQSQSNAMAILHVIVESTPALRHISNTLVTDTSNTYRIKAAEILEHLCSNDTNDDEYLNSLKKAVLDLMPKVLITEILGWGSTGAGTQAETDANKPRYSAADADLEEGPALPDNGQRNIYFSHQQNGEEQVEPGDNKLHEALLSLCVMVYLKLISADQDMACWFDEIASRICSEQRKPPKAFTLLLEEAREILKTKCLMSGS